MLQVITVCHDKTPTQPLIDSLVKHEWDFVVIETEWKGFGTKLIATYQYLKEHPEVTEFIFCDAFDVICLAGIGEFMSKVHFYGDFDMLVSAERGLWPPPLIPFRSLYEKTEMGFDYINSGCYYSKSESFIKIFEKYEPFYEIDDQMWLNMVYLMDDEFIIALDRGQFAFNSHSFIKEGEYRYVNNRVVIDKGLPVFIHKNGRSVDPKLDEMLNNLK